MLEDLFHAKEGERTFGDDDKLPPLPVPDLKHTLETYLDSVRAVTSDGEYEATKLIAEEFEKGIGKQLHALLLKRAEQHRNWV